MLLRMVATPWAAGGITSGLQGRRRGASAAALRARGASSGQGASAGRVRPPDRRRRAPAGHRQAVGHATRETSAKTSGRDTHRNRSSRSSPSASAGRSPWFIRRAQVDAAGLGADARGRAEADESAPARLAGRSPRPVPAARLSAAAPRPGRTVRRPVPRGISRPDDGTAGSSAPGFCLSTATAATESRCSATSRCTCDPPGCSAVSTRTPMMAPSYSRRLCVILQAMPPSARVQRRHPHVLRRPPCLMLRAATRRGPNYAPARQACGPPAFVRAGRGRRRRAGRGSGR